MPGTITSLYMFFGQNDQLSDNNKQCFLHSQFVHRMVSSEVTLISQT